MAKGYNSFTGKLDYDYWKNEFSKAGDNKTKAQNVITNMMKATTKGLGVSDNDQKQVVKLLDKYIERFGEDGIERVYNTWDPSKNHINELELDDAIAYWQALAKNPQIQFSGASVPASPSGMPAQSVNTPRDYSHVPAYNFVSAEPVVTNPYLNIKPNTNSTGSGSNIVNTPTNNTTTSTATPTVAEKPRVWSNAEAAAHLGLDYDLDKTLSEYNDATNTYYDEALALQDRLRNQYINNVGITATQAAEEYLDSYKNVAQTAANKGALATNLLSMYLNNAYDMAQGDQAYVQTERALEQARQAELANNKQLANEVYNKQGTWLSSWIANKNNADVNAYKDAMDSYSSVYAANRKAIASQAADVATKYSGLINAAATNANTQSNSLANLYKLYEAAMPNKQQAANSFWYDMTGGVK